MDISILFKIAAIGIIVTVICQILKKSDRDDIATVVVHRGLDTRPDGRDQYGRRPLRTNQTDIRPNLAALRQKNGDREKQRKRKYEYGDL